MNNIDKELLSKFEQSALSSSEHKIFMIKYNEDKEFRSVADGIGIQMAAVKIIESKFNNKPIRSHSRSVIIIVSMLIIASVIYITVSL